MAGFTALVDASVLYSGILTDLIIETSRSGIYMARWSNDIHEEWISALLSRRPDLTRAALERRRNAMDEAVPDCLVTGYEPLVGAVQLPDPDDNHVLAAAIAGHADVIVTRNLKHFPSEILASHQLEAQDPDTFLIHQRGLDEGRFLESVRAIRRRLMNPPKSPDEWLEGLEKAGLVVLASELRKGRGLL
jgi:predicted nucleic acid-binding protein